MILEMGERAEENVEARPEPVTDRGRLKIFLGMAAGVGKTYRMLQEGRA
jgi:K+-sensing histidine kinase KdpD